MDAECYETERKGKDTCGYFLNKRIKIKIPCLFSMEE